MDADRLVLDFALVMAVLLVAPLLSMRLRLPDIAGVILAGVVVGEYGLGWFHVDQTFQLLGKVGLLYLMFLAGLEINLNDFRRFRKPGFVFGTLTFLVPQVLGTVGARWILRFSWPESILLASMFASHTLIPFPLVQRFGIGRNRAVSAAVGGTILTDTAALLVLAVVVRGASGDSMDPSFWIRLSVSLAALVFGAAFLLPRVAYWFFRRMAPDGATEFVFVLAVVFSLAYAAELAGVEPIIGAFLAGLALSPVVPGRGVLTSRLHFVGYALFIPFFLLSVGMRVDLRALLAGPDGWAVAAFMSACVVGTKWLAAFFSGRILGFSRDETGLLFGLSVNQAAATLAAVLVGVRVGIFDDAVLNGAILMILATCILGPWVAEISARRLAEREDRSPSPPRLDSGRVLVPLASLSHADSIVDLALMLRPDRSSDPIYPLHVASQGPDDPARVAEAERLLAGAVARAEAAGVHAIPLARLDSSVAGGILNAASEFRAASIVVGWHARRSVASLLQSIPDRVVTQSGQTVVVYRPGSPLSTSRRLWLLVPPLVDRHSGLPTALRLARRIADRAGAKLILAATDETRAAIQSLSGTTASAPQNAHSGAPSWAEVVRSVETNRQNGDALVLVSVRRGNLAWQPSLERLPTDWARRAPGDNLIVIFPPLPSVSGETDLDPESDLHLPSPAFVATTSTALPEALLLLLRAALPDAGEKLHPLADSLAHSPPVPLGPDLALLHVHTPYVDSPVLVVGHNPAGFAIEGFSVSPAGLALLLGPIAASPERHLRTLAAIARAARAGSLSPPPANPPKARHPMDFPSPAGE